MARFHAFVIGIGTACLFAGCSNHCSECETKAAAAKKPVVHAIAAGTDAKKIQEALIKVKPGEVIQFAEGRFDFTMGLSLSVPDVTMKGAGIDKTILSFKGQNAGSEGIAVKDTDGVHFEDFAVLDAKGDAIKVTNAKGIFFQRVRCEWSGEPSEKNGAYGLYPVQCTNVLIDGCVAIGASDAGIYVGQSKNIIVRNCKAEKNVAGIEIENSIDADVYDNLATNNAGGLLVFDLPDLQQKNGQRVRVFHNQVIANNHKNFAPPGNTVASVPPGTGIMVMATDFVEVFDNDIKDNQTSSISLISYDATQRPVKDKQYDSISEGIYVHDNRISGGGKKPVGALVAMVLPFVGVPFPDIFHDGVINQKKAVKGELPTDLRLIVQNNGDARFVNIRLPQLDQIVKGKIKPDRDLAHYAGQRQSLPAVKIPGVQ